jgi:hypothetical protein
MRPRKRIQRCQWDCGSRFSGSMRPQNPLWHRGSPQENEYRLSLPLKGYYSKNKYIQKHNILIVARKRKC